jgi:hypothetical protein
MDEPPEAAPGEERVDTGKQPMKMVSRRTGVNNLALIQI